jgi:uncharacterized protein YuzE
MKLYYYADTDSLYIDLANRPSVDSREVLPGIVLDLDEAGALVGIDIDHASRQLDESAPLVSALHHPNLGRAGLMTRPAERTLG